LSSNKRIEPAVALNDSVRPGNSSLCVVVESAGSLCCSAAAGDAGGLAARLPAEPVRFAPGGVALSCAAGGASCARTTLQATEAIRILLGKEVMRQMIAIDLWAGRFRTISLEEAKRPDCVACGERRFEFLENQGMSRSTSLCGRNAIQVRPARAAYLDLSEMASKLATVGQVEQTPYLVRCACTEGEIQLTVFPDGRAIIQGVTDAERARSLYARFIGS